MCVVHLVGLLVIAVYLPVNAYDLLSVVHYLMNTNVEELKK